MNSKQKAAVNQSNGAGADDQRSGPSPKNDDALRRLRKIHGQVAGLIRMVDQERYCVDILTQVTAVRAALNGVGLSVTKRHLEHCVADAIRQGGEAGPRVVDELISVLRRANF
jgi:DNA-binding FrmR family transcriptional regulator